MGEHRPQGLHVVLGGGFQAVLAVLSTRAAPPALLRMVGAPMARGWVGQAELLGLGNVAARAGVVVAVGVAADPVAGAVVPQSPVRR